MRVCISPLRHHCHPLWVGLRSDVWEPQIFFLVILAPFRAPKFGHRRILKGLPLTDKFLRKVTAFSPKSLSSFITHVVHSQAFRWFSSISSKEIPNHWERNGMTTRPGPAGDFAVEAHVAGLLNDLFEALELL